jgi:hypothetical protein
MSDNQKKNGDTRMWGRFVRSDGTLARATLNGFPTTGTSSLFIRMIMIRLGVRHINYNVMASANLRILGTSQVRYTRGL